MSKKTTNQEFSERLRETMLKKGHASRTAACGVSPAALSKAVGCFTEMALRYLDGRSIPAPDVVLKIAEWLEVDPAYLLFGKKEDHFHVHNKILIDKEIIDYTLKKLIPLIKNDNNEAEIISFFISILSDMSLINMENDELKKVVDLAVKSTSFFNEKNTIGSKENGSAKTARKATS